MEVTDVLRDRMQSPVGFQRMVAASIAIHVAFGAALIFGPRGWLGGRVEEPPPLITITVSGGDGPTAGGFNPEAGRAVQEVRAPDEAPKREAVTPPAAKAPEMTLPAPNAKVTKATPPPKVTQAPEDARGRKPTKGSEVKAGQAIANAPPRGEGFGLSNTGGGEAGSGSMLDVADFCCPDYIALMVSRIRSVWQPPPGTAGQTRIKFTIERDGKIVNPSIERPSGIQTLDMAALRAVVTTRQITALPSQFTNPSLTVFLMFDYK